MVIGIAAIVIAPETARAAARGGAWYGVRVGVPPARVASAGGQAASAT